MPAGIDGSDTSAGDGETPLLLRTSRLESAHRRVSGRERSPGDEAASEALSDPTSTASSNTTQNSDPRSAVGRRGDVMDRVALAMTNPSARALTPRAPLRFTFASRFEYTRVDWARIAKVRLGHLTSIEHVRPFFGMMAMSDLRPDVDTGDDRGRGSLVVHPLHLVLR